MRHHDLVFLKHFSQVIAFLVAVTFSLILLGIYINGLKPAEPNKAAIAATNLSVTSGALISGCRS